MTARSLCDTIDHAFFSGTTATRCSSVSPPHWALSSLVEFPPCLAGSHKSVLLSCPLLATPRLDVTDTEHWSIDRRVSPSAAAAAMDSLTTAYRAHQTSSENQSSRHQSFQLIVPLGLPGPVISAPRYGEDSVISAASTLGTGGTQSFHPLRF